GCRDRARTVATGTSNRRLADAQPSPSRRRRPRLPVRAGGARPHRGLSTAATVRTVAGLGPRPDHPLGPAGALRRRGLRRAALRRARRGAPARRRDAIGPARRTTRRDRDRDPPDDAVPAARATEPAASRLPRAAGTASSGG